MSREIKSILDEFRQVDNSQDYYYDKMEIKVDLIAKHIDIIEKLLLDKKDNNGT